MAGAGVSFLLLSVVWAQEPLTVLKAMEIFEDYDPVSDQKQAESLNIASLDQQTVPPSPYESVLYVKDISFQARTDLESVKHSSLQGKAGYELPSIWLQAVESAAVVAIMQPELSTWDEVAPGLEEGRGERNETEEMAA